MPDLWSGDKVVSTVSLMTLGHAVRDYLLPAPVSALKLLQHWPLDLNTLILHFVFQAQRHGGRERCLMNCLVRRQLCLPISTYPSSQFLHHFLIYSHISAGFCWAKAFLLNWKASEVWTVHLYKDISFADICMLWSVWRAQKYFTIKQQKSLILSACWYTKFDSKHNESHLR